MTTTDHTESVFSRLAAIRADLKVASDEIVLLQLRLYKHEQTDLGAQIGEAANLLNQADDMLTPTASEHQDVPLPSIHKDMDVGAIAQLAQERKDEEAPT